MTISEEQSYSFIIRNILYDAAIVLPMFQNWTVRRTHMVPIQNYQLPFLGIYLLDDDMRPDGLSNSGHIKFIHLARVGFSICVVNNDADAAEVTLDRAFQALMNGFWTNQYITNLLNTFNPSEHAGNPDNVRFEGIEKILRRQPRWGTAGLNNETPIGELQCEITCKHRSYYEPIIPDPLLTIHSSTGFPVGGTEEQQAATQQVVTEYAFTAPPTAIANLRVTDVARNQVALAWDAATGCTGYIVQHSIKGLSFWRTFSAGDPQTAERIVNLAPNTPYEFRVCAMGEGGEGPWSSLVEATTLSTPVLPSTVTNLTVGDITASSIALVWDAATTGDIAQYRIQFALAGSGNWAPWPVSGRIIGTSITVAGLQAATAYDFRVAASGPAGDGGWSNVVTATTAAS